MQTYRIFPNRLSLFLSLLLWGSSSAWALISWDTTQITQKADPLTTAVTATFDFENIGDGPVTITEVKSSCGCTTAALEKKTYQPGETGAITATFNIGSRQGLQRKTIRVSTNDEDQPTVLTMKTLIPRVLNFKPAFVYWELGKEPEPKQIELEVGLDEPLRIVEAVSDNSHVAVDLEAVEEGRSYKLTLFPTSTEAKVRARITLKTDFPQEHPKTFYVYAHVK